MTDPLDWLVLDVLDVFGDEMGVVSAEVMEEDWDLHRRVGA